MSFMPWFYRYARPYGNRKRPIQAVRQLAIGLIASVLVLMPRDGLAQAAPAQAADGPLRIVVLGDSLVAGYEIAARDAFPAKLEAALKAKGHAVVIENAGVSGDT